MHTNKLRVVFILPSLAAGGAERVMITLMNGLDRETFDPVFIAVRGEGALQGLADPTIPFHDLNSSRVFRSLPALYGKLREVKPDIVVTTMAHMNFAALLLRPLFRNTRFIVREAVTPSFILKEHPALNLFLKLAYRTLYANATWVISPSQAIIDEFKSILSMKCRNHVLLRNPVNLDLVRAGGKTALTPDADRHKTVRFVASGRLHTQKGFDRLIENLPRLNLPYAWELVILGEGPERPALERLVQQQHLEDRVFLPGHRNAPWAEYAAADFFLMPSRSEGLPNVALEALACGTPVIATKESGGIAEIAALSAPGSVTVVNGMNEFIHAMEKATPNPAPFFRPSLLPEAFQRETIDAEFAALLKKA